METETKTDNELIAEWGYHISESGMVFGKNGKPLKVKTNKNGYLQLNAHYAGQKKTCLVHRLVAMNYIPNINNLPEVNHIDGDKLNNHKDNLEWCTRSENIRHGIANGLIPPPWKGKSGNKHPRSKAVLQIDKNNESVIVGEYGSIRDAAKATGIDRGTIDQVLSGKGKTAGGFKWKYKQ